MVLEMNYAKKAMKEIAEFITRVIDELDYKQIEAIVDKLVEAYRRDHKILVMGAGRSGLVGKAFAMRLMHMGFNSYVLGDTITPSIGEGDIVFAISGSGRTELIVAAVKTAKKTGAHVIAVTSYPESPLGQLADQVLQVPGRTKLARENDYIARQILGIHEPLAPLGTLFEDTTMVVLDGVVVELMHKLGKNEMDLKRKHANIEI